MQPCCSGDELRLINRVMHKGQSIICGNVTMLLPFEELALHKPGLCSCLTHVQFNIDSKLVCSHVVKKMVAIKCFSL